MDEETRRKLQAKRFNEHLKLLVTTVNSTALVVFGAGIIQPLFTAALLAQADHTINWAWVAVSAALHVCAQIVLRFIRPE